MSTSRSGTTLSSGVLIQSCSFRSYLITDSFFKFWIWVENTIKLKSESELGYTLANGHL